MSDLVAWLKGKGYDADKNCLPDYANRYLEAVDLIESQQAEIERLQDKLDRINQWCRAYPRTVFIEPTKEQWKRANEVLDDHDDCPSLTAISGSNMRHVVEGIQKIAALEQAND